MDLDTLHDRQIGQNGAAHKYEVGKSVTGVNVLTAKI